MKFGQIVLAGIITALIVFYAYDISFQGGEVNAFIVSSVKTMYQVAYELLSKLGSFLSQYNYVPPVAP